MGWDTFTYDIDPLALDTGICGFQAVALYCTIPQK
jgi:hypothetical protein